MYTNFNVKNILSIDNPKDYLLERKHDSEELAVLDILPLTGIESQSDSFE